MLPLRADDARRVYFAVDDDYADFFFKIAYVIYYYFSSARFMRRFSAMLQRAAVALPR